MVTDVLKQSGERSPVVIKRSTHTKGENNMKFSALNKNVAKFTYQLPEGTEFKKLADLELEKVYKVRGLWISHKGKYGDHPVIASDEFFIDIPKHLTNDVKKILEDPESVDQINNEVVGVTIYEYEKDGKTYRSINWHDLNKDGTIAES